MGIYCDPPILNFPEAGGTATTQLDSTGPWSTSQSPDDWVQSYSPTNGPYGDHTLTVVVPSNYLPDQRNTVWTLTSGGDNFNLIINQNPAQDPDTIILYPYEYLYGDLVVSAVEGDISGTSERVVADSAWYVSRNPANWVTLDNTSGPGGGSIPDPQPANAFGIQWSSNPLYTPRSTYLRVKLNNGADTDRLDIIQSGIANEPPVAGFTYSKTYLQVSFTNTSTDTENDIAGYLWEFGDGETSTDTNPTYTYTSAGEVTVTLTVTDGGGATDTHSKTFRVYPEPTHGLRILNPQGVVRVEVTDHITRHLGTTVLDADTNYILHPDNWDALTSWDVNNGGSVILTPVGNPNYEGQAFGDYFENVNIALAHMMTIQGVNALIFEKQPRYDIRADTVVELFMYQ